MKKILIICSARPKQVKNSVKYLIEKYDVHTLGLLLNINSNIIESEYKKKNVSDFFYYDCNEFFEYKKFVKSDLYLGCLKQSKFDMIVILYNHNHLGGKYYEEVEQIAQSIPNKIIAGFWLDGTFKIFDDEFIKFKNIELSNYYCRKANSIKEIAEFTGESFEVVESKIEKSELEGFKKWDNLSDKSEKNIINFYKNADFYIYQLMRSNNFNGGRTEYLSVIKKYLNKNDKIIDYGCGIGQIAISLSEEGYNISVADLDSKMFEFVRFRIKKRKLNIDSILLYGKNEDIIQTYDKIICLDVIEHVSFPESFLNDLNKILKPDGMLILRIPFDEINPINNSQPPLHFDYINKNNYLEIFENAGFEIYNEDSDLLILRKSK